MYKEISKDEQVQVLRKKVIQSEQERLGGAKTISISEGRMGLRKRVLKNDKFF